MKYVRFISTEHNTYFSDILKSACKLYIHNKMLRERNAFLLKGKYIYVHTNHGDLGVNFENNMTSVVIGEQIQLIHYIPNLYIIKCNSGYYKFKVGKRYVKVNSDRKIVLTLFKKLGTTFRMKHVKVIECEPNCLTNLFYWPF